MVGTVGTNKMEIFFLDPTSGAVPDGTKLPSGTVQNHISIALPISMVVHYQAIGDFDADGVPGTLVGNAATGTAWVNKGQLNASGALSYPRLYELKPAFGEYLPANFGESVATGKLYGSMGDVAGVAASGTPNSSYGGVFLFYWNGTGFSEYTPVYEPDKNSANVFGISIAFGAVTSAGSPDIVVGADSIASRASNSGTGKVWIFPADAFALSNNVSGESLSSRVGVADVTDQCMRASRIRWSSRRTPASPMDGLPGSIWATSTVMASPISWLVHRTRRRAVAHRALG